MVESEPPKKKASNYRPRGIETVCPEVGKYQDKLYLAPAQALGERLKDYPLILGAGGDAPTRLQWQFAVATEAINTLDIYPLQAVVNLHGDEKWDFHRAAYLRGLVAGIGDWLNAHQIKNKKGNLIDVLSDGWDTGVSLAPAKDGFVPISGGVTELHLCEEISEVLPREYLNTDVYRLFLDSFAPDYQSRNPIAGAVQMAREKVMKRLSAKGIDASIAVGVRPRGSVRNQAAPQPAPAKQDQSVATNEEVRKVTRKPEQQSPKAKVRTEKKRPQGPTAEAIKKAGIELPVASKKESVPAPEQSEAKTAITLDDLVGIVRQRIDEGIITANQAGAIFHGTPNGPALIVPKGFDVIAQVMKVDMASVEEFANSCMINAEVSFPNIVYRLHRPGRGWAKIKAGVLNSQVAEKLFPEGLETNPGIKTG